MRHAEDLRARIGVSLEVDEPDRAVDGRAGPYGRLGDRVVAAEDDGDGIGCEHLPDDRFDRLVRARRVRRDHRRIAEVHDLQLLERVEPRLEVWALRTAGGTDRAGRESRPGAVGDEIIGGRSNDHDVGILQTRGILGVARPAEAQQPGVVRFFAVLRPARERIDHTPAFLTISEPSERSTKSTIRRAAGASWPRPCPP